MGDVLDEDENVVDQDQSKILTKETLEILNGIKIKKTRFVWQSLPSPGFTQKTWWVGFKGSKRLEFNRLFP